MNLFLQLFQTMAVFLVVGYLYCKSPWFRPLTNQNLDRRDKVHLYFFFSALSIMGTYLGHPVHGALANTRAIGPVLAGMIGGPVLGTAVGFTGGLHRYFQGGLYIFLLRSFNNYRRFGRWVAMSLSNETQQTSGYL